MRKPVKNSLKVNNSNLSTESGINKILDATNGGFSLFMEEFALEIGQNRGSYKGFAVRSDDTSGSCHLHEKNGKWYFIDFGTSNKGVNVFDYFMEKNGWDFTKTLNYLFERLGISNSKTDLDIAPEVHFRNVEVDPSFFSVECFDKVRDTYTLRRIFPFFNSEIFEKYHFKEIKKYKKAYFNKEAQKYYVKEVHATDNFPIYGYVFDNFVKLYQPNAQKTDKFNFKHSFIGKKPQGVIYGLENLKKSVDIEKIKKLREGYKEATDKEAKKSIENQIKKEKLPYLIIATGGSDGLNMASLGANVVWFNSETETPTKENIAFFKSVANEIFYIPDLDSTGIKQGVKLGFDFLNIKLVWLPKRLLDNNKKDFTDWLISLKNPTFTLEEAKATFKKLLNNGLSFKFWSEQNNKINIHASELMHFLEKNNFYRFKYPFTAEEREDKGYFIRAKNNIIERVETADIRNFVLGWLRENGVNNEVWNKIFSTNIFNQVQLKSLPTFELNRNHSGEYFQYYFFENTAVKITKDTIEPQQYGNLKTDIWKDEVINHEFKVLDPSFKTYADEQGRLRIKILNKNSNYLKTLINFSRMYWLKDADENQKDLYPFTIDSPNLSDEEIFLQETHLLNKMYCIGYLLHQFKIQPKAWMVIGVDFVMGESVKGSYGGTGKSFMIKQVKHLLGNGGYVSVGARGFKDDKFMFDGVSPKTKVVTLEDLPAYENLTRHYNLITDNFLANQKGGVMFNIPFEDSPKLSATTNFAPDLSDNSNKRRVLIYHNSDYYHEQTQTNNYAFTRKISDDFNGKEIMAKHSYTPEQWNTDYNFMLECLKFYLNQDQKLDAPLDELIKKNKIMKIGDSLYSYLNSFFEDENNFNKIFSRPILTNQIKEEIGKGTSYSIRNKIDEYCEVKGYESNLKKRKLNGVTVESYFFTKKCEKPTQEPEEVPF